MFQFSSFHRISIGGYRGYHHRSFLQYYNVEPGSSSLCRTRRTWYPRFVIRALETNSTVTNSVDTLSNGSSELSQCYR